MHVVRRRLGHRQMGLAEQAKIDLSDIDPCTIALDDIEPGLATSFDRRGLADALARPLDDIVAAAREIVRRAQVDDDALHVLHFTGGSTGVTALSSRVVAAFLRAEAVLRDRYSSVASGLGIEAASRYGVIS